MTKYIADEDLNASEATFAENGEGQTPEASAHADNETEQVSPVKTGSPWWSIVAVILCLAAWASLLFLKAFGGYLAIGLALLSIVAGFLGARRRNYGWRNLAITGIIASTVLAVVIVSFIIVLKVGLS